MNPERIFDPEAAEEEIEALYHFNGFKEWRQAEQNVFALMRILGGNLYFVRNYIKRIFSVLKGLSDPDRALTNLVKYLEKTRSPFMDFNYIFQDLSLAKLLCRIFSDSQYFSDILVRYPEFFDWLIAGNYSQSRSYDDLFQEALSCVQPNKTTEKKIHCLRRFQKRQMLRIGANDILGKASLEQTVRELSDLADVCIEIIYRIKKEQIGAGQAEDFDLAVLALGKLGGKEVNYSSDIDIIFVGMGNLQLANQLAVTISRELSCFSEEGYFYRVDNRLRPEGDRGPLLIGLEGYLNYFDNRAKVWERQAYLKARFSAGNRELGNLLLKSIEEFIFKKYLSSEEINRIKKLKKGIEGKAQQKKEWKREVKIGYGGIRDIEFFVQLIQLLYGGRYSKLKTGNTLEALNALREIEFISYSEYHSLYQNYVFLRRIEHFLQIMDYQQTHVLPDKEDKRRILAFKMGYTVLPLFEKQYAQTTQEVRSIFKKYFEDIFESQAENIADVFFEAREPEDVRKILEEYGFTDIKSTFHLIKNMEITAKNELRFLSALQDIFSALKENSIAPDKALVNIIRIVKAYRGEDVFFDLIQNSREFLNILVKIASISDMMVQIIERNPSVLDFLTEPSILYQPARKKDIARIIRSVRQDMGFDKALRLIYDMELFRIGAQDILNIYSQEQISISLSILAETLLKETFFEHSGGMNWPIAIIMLGKLGGRELSYCSDLDIILVSGSSNAEEIYAQTQFAQLVLAKIKEFYVVDLRLRPDGRNAPLLIGLDGFKKYLKDEGKNWERLVYSRSRVWATSLALRQAIGLEIEDFVYQTQKNFKSDIVAMREKISASFNPKNFKKHLGGIMDLEFMLEYQKIIYKIRTCNLQGVIHALSRKKALESEKLKLIRYNLVFYKTLENALRLYQNHHSCEMPEQIEILRVLAQKTGMGVEEFKHKFQEVRDKTLELWNDFKKGDETDDENEQN